MKNPETLIESLGLLPHPEGGYYKEVYRSNGIIKKECLPAGYAGDRNFTTSIYFMLTGNSFSAFHRIKQDEIWHHYDGSTILIHVIDPDGNYSCVKVGKNYAEGEVPQFVVEGGCWFASEVTSENPYALVGCTVAPGFDFDDFELPPRAELIAIYPQHEEVITRLTRK